MKPIKVAICDDNPKDREFLHKMCKAAKELKNMQIKLKEYKHGDALLFDLEDTRVMNTVDIVLLDISMPGKDGIDVARALREYGYQGAIIFVTQHNEHWRDAFDLKAFNYITKDKQDIEKRFIRVFMEALEDAASRIGKTLLFSSISETRKIDVASISIFEVKDHLVTVYYGKEKFEFISSLAKIETLLFGNDDFKRVHRSFLISIPHIEKIEEQSVIMINGKRVPVAKKYMRELKALMV